MRRLATVRVRITIAATLVVGVALAVGGFWLVRSQRDALTGNVETAARLRSRDIVQDRQRVDRPHHITPLPGGF